MLETRLTGSVTDRGVEGGANDGKVEGNIRSSQTLDVLQVGKGRNAGKAPLIKC